MKNRTLFLLGMLTLAPAMAYSQCGQYPTLELGNDTVLCPNATYLLQAPAGYDSYSWSTGSTLDVIPISAPGTYTLNVTNVGTNLVINGDFESGNQDFSS